MWLLPVFSPLAKLACRIFYRLRIAGPRVPKAGPVLLVANHTNALLDPALVVATAKRRVRFLAKSPLFSDRLIGWLVRGAGSIPVYRQSDDPSKMTRNEEMFRAVHAALAGGSAIGIFPEGKSHDAPSLQPLKTGTARIALGTAQRTGAPFPIVPVGMVHEQKERFRSRVLVVLGQPIDWKDLAGREVGDGDAVHELTARIERGLRQVTLNLESWEDRRLVEYAEQIWSSGAQLEEAPSRELLHDPADRMRRLEIATRLLAEQRLQTDPQDPNMVGDLRRHIERLSRLGLSPERLANDSRLRTSVRWSASRFYLLGVPAISLAVLGLVLFWLPFKLTGWLSAAFKPNPDQVATYKLLWGVMIYGLWVLGCGLAAAMMLAPKAGVLWRLGTFAAGLIAFPLIGMLGLWVRERWRGAVSDLRSFVSQTSRRQLIHRLKNEQSELADRVAALVAKHPEISTRFPRATVRILDTPPSSSR